MNPNNEQNLVRQISRGDEAALSEIYRIYHVRVYGFAYRMTLNQAAAEDITHEVFVFLIEHPDRFQTERGSLLTFLCAVARNLVMNHLRRKHHSDIGFDELENFDVLEDETQNNPLTDLLNRELAGRIENCIAELPPLQREAIILREYQELSYEEIARVTEADLSAVKARLHRARRALARNLAAYVNWQKEKHHELC